ncbi:hypothetical protein BDN71DRAFT_930235 [Pleurotus eryngii]|uniref:Uncharacterized protein n=1 Tax=Pleurotus eryngii TaxID=5323 RepID=A0A9P6D6J3_PLEER|nr:hypothetical protein BDN71DRAFT_930235 [Pleurotus eryngii]
MHMHCLDPIPRRRCPRRSVLLLQPFHAERTSSRIKSCPIIVPPPSLPSLPTPSTTNATPHPGSTRRRLVDSREAPHHIIISSYHPISRCKTHWTTGVPLDTAYPPHERIPGDEPGPRECVRSCGYGYGAGSGSRGHRESGVWPESEHRRRGMHLPPL